MRRTKRLLIAAIAVTAAIVTLLAIAVGRIGAEHAVFKEEQSRKILIDVGHGGSDGGAVSISGVKEAQINLEIALRLKDVFERRGYEVVMTRDEDKALADDKKEDMRKRRELIETSGQDVTVSIHQNFFADTSCTGPQVFYAAGSEQGRILADNIQQAVNAAAGGEKPRVAMTGDYYIVKSGSVPAVIVECGFISNAEEESRLLTPSYQLRLAKAIADGVGDYLKKYGGADGENTSADGRKEGEDEEPAGAGVHR